MEEAIKYYQRKLDKANDLTGIAYIHKLIQLEHQPTIEKTLEGLRNVQYPRHFPNHLVVQLARLNRPDINESLISYFKMHFKATNTEWHAISALQDDRVVETVVNAINQYEKSYFSRKVVTRCIHLLGRIGSYGAYEALKNIVEAYLKTNNRFIDNYEVPLATEAIEALARIDIPQAQDYLQDARRHYQQRIVDELGTYPERLIKERTEIGINLHEGSALSRMKQYALPTLIEWHQNHPSAQVRDFALKSLLSNLQVFAAHEDDYSRPAVRYLLSLYEHLKDNHKLVNVLKIVENCKDPAVTDFAWRAFREGIATDQALNVLARQKADGVFQAVLERFTHHEDKRLATRENIISIKSYINYFGQIASPEAETVLTELYQENIQHLQFSIAEAMLIHAQERDTALDFLNDIIETNADVYVVKQTILLLHQIGNRALLILLSLLDCNDVRRNFAVEALGLLRNPQSIPHLMETLLNNEIGSELEELTVKALERIGTEAGYAALNAWEVSQ